MNYLIDPIDLAYYLSMEEYQNITDEGYICGVKIEDLENLLFSIKPEEFYEEAKNVFFGYTVSNITYCFSESEEKIEDVKSSILFIYI